MPQAELREHQRHAEAERRGEGEDDGGAGHPDLAARTVTPRPATPRSAAPPSARSSTTTSQGGSLPHEQQQERAGGEREIGTRSVMPAVQTGS